MCFSRPARRSWALGCVLPGFTPLEEIDLCIAIDMSGSISDEMANEMLSEIIGMTEQFNCFKIKLLTFDTKIYNPVDITENTIDELWEYKAYGGGGTNFHCIWEHLKDEDYVPEQLVVFTDGYPMPEGQNGGWGDDEYCETLFVIHGNTTIEPPFGEVTYYEFELEY